MDWSANHLAGSKNPLPSDMGECQFLNSLSMEEKMGMSIINTMEAAHEKSITNCIR